MAADIHKVDFQISATDHASRVIQGVAGSVKGLHGNFIALSGAAAAALGAGGVAAFVADAVRYRGALDDLSDTTGDNVRTLDAMARQARISGLEFENLSSGLTKFARNLNAAGDEGKDAAKALTAIGLNVDELRAKKPADAMLDVARALGQFEDGAGKVAVAIALMGKEGAKQLPFLKDLAQAGDLQGKITAEEAAQAERLEKEWRKLTQAFIDGKQAIATAVIPVFGDLIEQMREGIRIAGSFGNALRLFGRPSMVGEPGDLVNELMAKRDALPRAGSLVPSGNRFDPLRPFTGQERVMAEDDIARQLEFARFLQRQKALKRSGAEFEDARDIRARQKPALDFAPSKPGKGGAGAGEDYSHLFAVYEAQLKAEKELLGIAKDRKAQEEALLKIKESMAEQREKSDAIVTMALFKRDRGGVIPFDEDVSMMEEVKDQVKETNDFARQMGLTFSSAFEDAVRGGKKFSEVLKGIGNDILGIMLRKNVTEPLGNWASGLFSGAGGGGGGFLSSLSGLFGGGGGAAAGAMSSGAFGLGMMGFAEGTDYVPYDMVAKIHQGEKIIPAEQNRGGAASVVNLHFHSADPQGARTLLMQHSETIKNIIRKGYNDNGRSPGF